MSHAVCQIKCVRSSVYVRQKGKGWQAYDVIRWHLADRGHATDGTGGLGMSARPYSCPPASARECRERGHLRFQKWCDTNWSESPPGSSRTSSCGRRVSRASRSKFQTYSRSDGWTLTSVKCWPFGHPVSDSNNMRSSEDTSGTTGQISAIFWITVYLCCFCFLRMASFLGPSQLHTYRKGQMNNVVTYTFLFVFENIFSLNDRNLYMRRNKRFSFELSGKKNEYWTHQCFPPSKYILTKKI